MVGLSVKYAFNGEKNVWCNLNWNTFGKASKLQYLVVY